MQVILFAGPDVLAQLVRMTESWRAEVVAKSSTAPELLSILPRISADLVVLDPDLDFHGAAQIARAVRTTSPASLAFLAPTDAIVGDVLRGLDPIGFLPRSFDRGDIGSLLATARSMAEPRNRSTAGGPHRRLMRSDQRLEVAGLVSMLLAVLVGYFLPDGLPILEQAGHKAYYLVAGLAMMSITCLLAARRPLAAWAQVGVIALVTFLPTQP